MKSELKYWQEHATRYEDLYNELISNKVALLKAINSIKEKPTPAHVLRAADIEKKTFDSYSCDHVMATSYIKEEETIFFCPQCKTEIKYGLTYLNGNT